MKGFATTCCTILGLLFLACGKAPAPTDVPFQTLAMGSFSGVKEPTDRVFKTEPEFDAIWKTLSSAPDRAVPVPTIDFGSEMVIGTFAGSKPSSGYATEIRSIRETGDELQVQVEDSKPTAGAKTMDMITYPYHIVKVKKTDQISEKHKTSF